MTAAFLDALDDDLAGFLTDFGEVVVYQHDLDAPFEITGIFDSTHALVDQADQLIDGDTVWLRVSTNDVPDIDYEDTVTIRDQLYTVVGIEHDGTGQTVLRLHET